MLKVINFSWVWYFFGGTTPKPLTISVSLRCQGWVVFGGSNATEPPEDGNVPSEASTRFRLVPRSE